VSSDLLQGKCILVVEDNEAAREGLAFALCRSGCAVTAVAEGGQALALIRTGFLPDLVLLDMQTPGLDGWDFLVRRRGDPTLAAVPVVIHTSLGVASPQWAAGLGAAGLLRKPAEMEQLVDEVRRYLSPSPAGWATETTTRREG